MLIIDRPYSAVLATLVTSSVFFLVDILLRYVTR
jgi:hypothetical protein